MDFPGCLAVVSHDRYFLNRVCTDILAFEGNGQLTFQHGDYQYYLEKRQESPAGSVPASESAGENVGTANRPAPAPSVGVGKKRLTWKEQRELESMEETILAAEAQVADLEAKFTDPEFHAKYGRQTAELTAQLDAAKAEVERLYARWTELEDKRPQK